MSKLQTGVSASQKTCQTCALFAKHGVNAIAAPNCHGNNINGCAFWKPIVKDGLIGEAHIEITVNKEEILRDLDEIQKKAEEVAKALEAIPSVNVPSVWIGDPICGGTTTIATTTNGNMTVTYAKTPSTPTGE